MINLFRAHLITVILFAVSLVGLHAQQGDVWNVHDPFIIAEKGNYYVFSTGRGIPIRQSTDLIHWRKIGRVFENLPLWAAQTIPSAKSPWAPGIIMANGRYLLYYALSTFGSTDSCIALAFNKTLDPTSPDYHWEDQGIVLRSHPGDRFNAIDPNPVMDTEGALWLAYGSFSDGIKLRRLDAGSGKIDLSHPEVIPLARRPKVYAIEAAHIIHHGEWYYLFVSFDYCCRGAQSTYNIRVGRSAKITGPYVDHEGKPMMLGGGTLLLGNRGRFIGPGHNSVLQQNGKAWLVYHYYNADWGGTPTLQMRPLDWSREGWPSVGEPLANTP